MKKTITSILLIISFIRVIAQKNDSIPKYNWKQNIAIKVNLLSITNNFINIQLEQGINNKSAFNLIYVLGYKNNDGSGSQGYSIGLEYRYYKTGSPTNGGFYIAPFLRYRDFSFIETHEKTNAGIKTIQRIPIPYTNYSVGFVFGRQWVFLKNKILVDAFVGPEYNTKSTKNNPAATTNLINTKDLYDIFMVGTSIRWGATIGYKF